ncbi:MAG: helix-turn-helix transcriptional regulator [Rhodothermaceae bacterium]|nr:helix-turn-helix transcriptional regulator [Rhodothermaceae bacterium]MXW33449.1 helix-turn-helix transcriptional regulator [Rhodothermaceae bacterium]MYC05520.1 helix-turn-helix transcriptional regulator [Rhodothermaceae bacterium]MYE62484.1 helix-turn-helix transcriptional regulator [Rhodothermaceae bacterium]MYI18137.1 helix-turn-helix transcriptional regulator [Rhodothermaceae bacterium]
MSYKSDHLSTAIRKARVRMGLSQRDLSIMSGVSQAQISKFENGAIDLRLSSLVALFRAMDLELELVPKICLPAVQSIVRSTTPRTAINPKLLTRAKSVFDRVFQDLVKSEQWSKESEHLQEHMDFLERIRIPVVHTKNFKRWVIHLERFQETPPNREKIKKLLKRTMELQKQIERTQSTQDRPLGPAYSLKEEDRDA